MTATPFRDSGDRSVVERAADAFFAAAATGDEEGFRAVTTPDPVLWQNPARRERGREQVLRHLVRLRATAGSWEYHDVHRLVAPDGFCEQHVVRFRRPDGTTHEFAACVVARVDAASGRITRLDEYVDGAAP